MVKDTTNKKTLWGRFKSWLAGTWLGKAWSSFTGWFSSSDATKAGAANSPASGVPSNDAGVPVPELDKGQGLNQEDEVDLVSNGLSATDTPAVENPAEPTPSNGTSATSPSGSGGPATGGESDMQETKQNPVQSNPTPVGGMRATPQQGFKALIKIDGENLKFVSMTADTADYIMGCKNPANGKECLVYVKHGEDMYRIIFTTDDRNINSVAKQHKSTKHMNDNAINPNGNMESVKTLFGLNATAPRVEITEISNVPFEVPEVKSPEPTVSDKAQLTNPEQSFIKVTNKGQLRLHATVDHMTIVGSSTNPQNRNEYLVYLKIGGNTYRITSTLDCFINDKACFLIKSVANQDGTDASNNPVIMMKKLGLVGEKKFVNITEMSKVPLKVPEAAPTIPSHGDFEEEEEFYDAQEQLDHEPKDEQSANGEAPSSTSTNPSTTTTARRKSI